MTLIYCVKCKEKTDTENETTTTMKNGRPALKGTCSECGTQKYKFLPLNSSNKCPKKGGGLVNKLIESVPIEMHIPGFNFCGPGTKLKKRLNADDTPKKNSKPINRVDEACLKHDLFYRDNPDTASRHIGDAQLLQDLKGIYNPTISERFARGVINPIISTKKRFGMGLSNNKKKKNAQAAKLCCS